MDNSSEGEIRDAARPEPGALKALQDPIAEWRQLEALRLVAGGLAHDLNNYVTIIGHTAELAEMMNDHARHLRAWEQVRTLCERARMTVGRIQALSRQASGRQQRLDLGELTLASIRLLRASVPSGVKLTGKIEVDACSILGNANQIQEFFIHVVHAAATALPITGGEIDIRLVFTAKQGGGAAGGGAPMPACCSWFRIRGTPLTPGLWAGLRETPADGASAPAGGVGELAARLRALLAAHGARVREGDEPSQIGIEWPICDAVADPAGARGLPAADQAQELRGWQVAVVEDEPRELDLLRDVLHARGARVSAFAAARDFLRWIEGGPPPDLLIVDQVLDELSGEVLAERMHEVSPGTPVLLIGALLQAGTPAWAGGRPLRTLPKPFAFADLFAALKTLPVGTR